jgi:hypothetical protein
MEASDTSGYDLQQEIHQYLYDKMLKQEPPQINDIEPDETGDWHCLICGEKCKWYMCQNCKAADED